MGIFILKYKDRYRPYFYGAFKLHGKRHTIKLGKIRGKPPKSLKMSDIGDAPYERSKQKALDALKIHVDNARGKTDASNLIRQAIEIQTGHDDMDVRIADLGVLNRERRRIKEPTKRERDFQDRVFADFTEFAKKRRREYLFQVDQQLADDYFDELIKTYAWNSVGKRIFALSGAFKRFAPTGMKNPFAPASDQIKGGKKKFPQTPHRPLTEEQLRNLLHFVRNDDLLRPLVICTVFTGLRLGDACTLRRTEVDLQRKLIIRKTNKTGTEVTVPMFPEVESEISAALLKREKNEPFVFPLAARKYSPDDPTICNLGKRAFARALFGDEPEEAEEEKQPPIPPERLTELLADSHFPTRKKDRILDVYTRFLSGQSYREIERQTGHSRGQISDDLATTERLSGIRVRPLRKKQQLSDLIAKTQDAGTSGRNKRSLYGWHSLRSTFVVLALMRGVPLELVRRIVGHSTVEMTLKYFNPTEAHVAELFSSSFKSPGIGGWGTPARKIISEAASAVASALLNSLTNEQKEALKAQLT